MIVKVQCWRCHNQYDVFFMHEILRSHCGAVERVIDDPCAAWRNWNLAKEVFAAEVTKLRCSVKRRYSDTMGQVYWSFGCPRCNAIYGRHYLRHMIMEHEDPRPVLLEEPAVLRATAQAALVLSGERRFLYLEKARPDFFTAGCRGEVPQDAGAPSKRNSRSESRAAVDWG